MISIPLAIALAASPAPLANEPVLSLPPLNMAALTAVEPSAPEEGTAASLLSYTFIEIGGTQYDVDAFDETSDVYYGRASIGLFGFLYAFGEYQNQSSDFQNTDTDVIALGAGAHFAVMPKLDIFGELSYLYYDISSDLSTLDDTTEGYEAAAGARFMVLPWDGGGIEVNGKVNYIDLGDVAGDDYSETGWEVGARVHFLRLFSIGASYAEIEDDDEASINARVSF